MSREYTLLVGQIPPSVNRAYRPNGFGGLTLSPSGKKFKLAVKMAATNQFDFDMEEFDSNRPYELVMRVHMKLYNSTWPGKAKNRFKKQDTSNMIKLLEDSVCEVVGIDDSCIVKHTLTKTDSATEFVTITIREFDE